MKKTFLDNTNRRMIRVVKRLADWRWTRYGIPASWVGDRCGGAWVDLSRLNAGSIVYSFGLGWEISFDRDIIKRTGCSVFGFDPDPRSIEWLDRDATYVPDRMSYWPFGISTRPETLKLGIPDPEASTTSVLQGDCSAFFNGEFLPLDAIMAKFGHKYVDYLKCDIEGAEFELIQHWLSVGYRPPVGQMWIEFHPNGNYSRLKDVERLVRSMRAIGFHSAKRNSWASPVNYFLAGE